MSAPTLYIGLDAGGTKTELLARPSDQGTPWAHTGPAANLQRLGLEKTAQVLAALIREAHTRHPDLSRAAVCAGVAGAGSADDQHALAARLRHHLADQAPAHLQVTHDGTIALEAAFEGGSGLIVIAGTGSSLFARAYAGDMLRAGGWGYLLGDEGSGYALGLHGLRAVAHAFDGGPPTRLQALLADRHGLATPDALKRSVYRETWPIQQMAPLVIEAAAQGDVVSTNLVTAQTDALARQAAWLAEKHPGLVEKRLALLGGLVRSTYYRGALTKAMAAALPGWHIQSPMHPPVVGALRLATAGLP